MSVATATFIFLAGLLAAEAFPSGAPSGACATLTPSHGSNSPQSSTVPYSIDLIPFSDGAGGYQYTPGETYTITLSGNSGEMFRGFLVQCRLMSDDTSTEGTFAANATDTRLSSCSPTASGVTHSNNADRTSTSMQWTAPSAGTGDVRFAFAVVQTMPIFWANRRSAVISEVPPPPPTPEPTMVAMPTIEPPMVVTATPEPTATPTAPPTEMTETMPTEIMTETMPSDVTEGPPTVTDSSGSTEPTATGSSNQPQSEGPTASASGVVVSALSILLTILGTMFL